ncbi:unnamed protein product [Tetraodon nigroviridis]|uniref:(spotted green pufferfish) hypothetical protein n=1 Tax=Tetraodon nigroviridis TaxID=99883 RepID=Q4S396_TETNG|nr:unnamed protein product [Tetraodon nigroviridis]
MAEKTITEVKKLFLVISNQYQEYKEVVGQLKQVLSDRGKTIMNNKLEIFTLKKEGYSGPPEDEQFFKICHAMQRKLLKAHTETYFKDFMFFERSIEKKFQMMDTELQHLQKLGTLWDEKQDPVEKMSKILKRKEMEIRALKQEMHQLFKQKEQDRIQITTLEQGSKPANDKIILLKQTYEKERSMRRQILEQLRQTKGECKELDSKLKALLEENNCLNEKYQKENNLHKNTKANMKQLQVRFQQMVEEKNCFQSKYEKEKIKRKQTEESLDKTIEELHVQLKETVKEHKCVEKSYEKEKSAHKSTKEALDQIIEELRGQLQEVRQQQRCLEKTHEKEKSAHKSTKETLNQVMEEQARKMTATKEELGQTMRQLEHRCSENQVLAKHKAELQVQLQNTIKEKKALEENYQQEKKTREELEQSEAKLQSQLQQANEQIKVMCERTEQLEVEVQQGKERFTSLEEKYLEEVDDHETTRDQLGQNIQELQGKNQLLENEKSSHIKTQEELAQASHQNKENSAKIEELQFHLQQTREEYKSTKENYQEEMSAHKHTKERLNRLQEDYEKEKSGHKHTREELEQCLERARGLQVRLRVAEEENISLEKRYRKETLDLENMTAKAEELLVLQKEATEKNKCLETKFEQESFAHVNTRKELEQVKNQNRVINDKILQLQQAIEEKESIHQNQVTEISGLQFQIQHTVKELDQVKRQNKIMEAKLEEIEELMGKGKNYSDLQVRSRGRQFMQDLHACLSVISDAKNVRQRVTALKRCYLENEQMQIGELVEHVYQLENNDLKKRLQGCEHLLKDKSETISRLEQELSGILHLCDDRERKYVQMLNSHLVKEHQLKKELEKTLLKLEKAPKQFLRKVNSWWHKKVQKNTLETPEEEEEQIDLYPEDWRLPDFPVDNQSLGFYS